MESLKMIYYTLILFSGILILAGADEPCQPRKYDSDSIVCVCNADYCDTLDVPEPSAPGNYLVYTTSRDGLRFEKTEGNFQSHQPRAVQYNLDRSIRSQTILGFGGAFTDAAGLNIVSLSDAATDQIMKSYFSPSGIQYNVMRTPMAGADYSVRTYSYDDVDGDVELTYFSLQEEDLNYKIPLINRAKDLSTRGLKLFGSPWSGPKWMKSNNEFNGEGHLLPEHYQTWANYFVKFLQEYDKQNISFWGLTAQNEPTAGVSGDYAFNCMGFTPEQQATFIAENLGPTLESSGYGDVVLMINDDQRSQLPRWADIVMSNPGAAPYVDGIAVHWYADGEPAQILTNTHNLYPNQFILPSEACAGFGIYPEKLSSAKADVTPKNKAVVLGWWQHAEDYAFDILEDLNNWSVGWVEWNLALDNDGGPNWAGFSADAPVIVNVTSDEFYKQPIFYTMGHFSKFILPGAVKINIAATDQPGGVDATAFLNPDGGVTVVIMNGLDTELEVSIAETGPGTALLTLPPHSLQTVLYWY